MAAGVRPHLLARIDPGLKIGLVHQGHLSNAQIRVPAIGIANFAGHDVTG